MPEGGFCRGANLSTARLYIHRPLVLCCAQSSHGLPSFNLRASKKVGDLIFVGADG